MLRQLGSRLAPGLLQAGGLRELAPAAAALFHSSPAACGVGIPERKSSKPFTGNFEGEGTLSPR